MWIWCFSISLKGKIISQMVWRSNNLEGPSRMASRKLMKEFESGVMDVPPPKSGIFTWFSRNGICIGIEPINIAMFQPNRNLWLGNNPRPFWMPTGESRSREHCGFLSPAVRQLGCGEKCHHRNGQTSPFPPSRGLDGIWMGHRMVPSYKLISKPHYRTISFFK